MKILIILSLLLNSLAFGADSSSIWGKLVKVEEGTLGIGSSYYIYFEEKGEARGYPLDVKNPVLLKELEKNVSGFIRLTGDVKEQTIKKDGLNLTVLTFIPKTLSPLSLGELSVKDSPNIYRNDLPKSPKEKSYAGGIKIQIPDAAANTLIIGGGAAFIIGSLLKGKL